MAVCAVGQIQATKYLLHTFPNVSEYHCINQIWDGCLRCDRGETNPHEAVGKKWECFKKKKRRQKSPATHQLHFGHPLRKAA